MNWLINLLNNVGSAVFTWLDDFGHDHWGFILAAVFFLYIGDRLQLSLARMHRRTTTWQRGRMMARTSGFGRRMDPNLGGTGFGQRISPETASNLGRIAIRNTPGFNPPKSGRTDLNSMSDVELASQLSIERVNRIRPYLPQGE